MTEICGVSAATASDPQTLTGFVAGARYRSHEVMAERVSRAAAVLSQHGISSGDRVAVLMRNDFPFIEASYAVTALGAITVPINWHGRAEDVAYILQDSGAKLLVAHADMLDVVPPDVPLLAVDTPPEIAECFGFARAMAPLGTSWDDALRDASPLSLEPRPAPPSMIYTSGTTGPPKGVRRARPLDPNDPQTAAALAAIGIRPAMRTVICGPMYHAAPNVYALVAGRTGGLVVLEPNFDAEKLLELIERYAITALHLVPTMMVRLLRLDDETRNRYDLSSLELVVHAAAPCPQPVKRGFIEWLGPIVSEYYGGTETGAVVACDSAEWLAHPGTVGKPLPGCTVRIIDEHGTVVKDGEIGDVYAWNSGYGDFVYEGKPEKRAEVQRGDLVTVGDVGYLDTDGFLHLTDRKSDMIISGGVNVYPQEAENLLATHPRVADAAVFGIPDADLGERVHAVIQPLVVTDAGPELERELLDYLQDRLAKYKCPRAIHFRAELPRHTTGKLYKRLLRNEYVAASNVTD